MTEGGAASGRNRAADSSAAVTTPSGRRHLLLETATLAGEEEPVVEDDAEDGEPDELSEYPRLTSLSAQLSRDAFADEFDDALHDLIKRVASFHS